MNRHWVTLEYPHILARLAEHTDFSGGRERALALEPAPEIHEARDSLALTGEARELLLARPDFALGGVHDIRPQARQAEHGVTLHPPELLRVRDTLQGAARTRRLLTRLEAQFPRLADIAWRIVLAPDLVDAIARVFNDRGEVRDDASPTLARIRRELRITQSRVQDRLQRMLTSPQVAPYLQEALITRREGRFVLPVQADFKRHVRGIVHDRSGSGATLFIEPTDVVDMNNTLRELTLAEEDEILRLLQMLTAQIGDLAPEIVASLDALVELDLVFAKARYAVALDASAPELLPLPEQPPQLAEGDRDQTNFHPGTVVRLLEARHPLLDPETVVPVNVDLDDQTHMLVLTGPNTGGKTVTLKTVGLLTLMARAGMHLPVAPGSQLSCFEAVYADIGDEQSIEQSLSTFSSHLNNIVAFLKTVDHRALVLLDELGAGTDPAEGAALARALLEAFRERRSTVLVATHYPDLKLYAHATPGARNASMEFDVETLAPTYRLTIGLPGRSNAFAIAHRLGLPPEIVKHAQGMLSGEALRAEDMLDDLHNLRLQRVRARDQARQAQRDAEDRAAQLRDRLAGIEHERRELLAQAEAQGREVVAALQDEVRALRDRLLAAPGQIAAPEVDAVADAAAALEVRVPQPEPLIAADEIAAPEPAPEPTGVLAEGSTVRIPSLGVEGTVLALEGDEAVIQAGAMRTRLPLEDVELLRARPASKPPPTTLSVAAAPRPSPGVEIDLRGQTAAEALANLDAYLDDAAMAALPWVRIIHGKGTGKLRHEVRHFLATHPLVPMYESASEKEGGSGVTVAKLVTTR